MKAALRSKLAAVGPVMHVEDEVRRFLPWLPSQVQFFVREAGRWMRLYGKEQSVQKRIDLERQALEALQSHIAIRITMPGQGLLEAFLLRLQDVMRKSYAAREAALRHERVEDDLDIRMLSDLESWLERNSDYPDEPELAIWLRRILQSWRQQHSR